MRRYAVIVAGGSGSRMKSDIPKQFLELAGMPILMHTLKAFYEYDSQIELILCLPAAEIRTWIDLCQEHNFTIPHTQVKGGETRYHSVKNGLDTIEPSAKPSYVAIHDGVRPLLSRSLLERCFEEAKISGNSIPSVALKDSIRMVDDFGGNMAVDRSKYRSIQTPQTFSVLKIKKAFESGYQEVFTDDASVFEADGQKIHLIEGDYKNIKITTPDDLLLAEVFRNKKGE